MKYIRTKNKVLSCSRNSEDFEAILTDQKGWVKKEKILKQARTIQELCDEFVYTGSLFSRFNTLGYGTWDGTRIEQDKEMHKELLNRGCVFYAAIWTDKGLIYVAKMNEKGDLELL